MTDSYTEVRICGSQQVIQDMNAPSTQRQRVTCNLALAAIAFTLGFIGVGSVFGYSAPTLPEMESYDKPMKITADQGEWFGSLISLGSIVGCLISGFLMDKIGRKRTLTLAIMNHLAGFLLISFSKCTPMLYCGRILTGIYVGTALVLLPIYLGEICPPDIRGLINAICQIGIPLGIIVSFSFAYFVFWNWLALICAASPAITLIILVFMPDTPFWLLKNGNPDKAKDSIMFFQGKSCDLWSSFDELVRELEKPKAQTRLSLSLFKDPAVCKSFFLSMNLILMLQLSGIPSILFYVESIFKDAKSSIDPKLATIFVGLTQVAGAFLSCFVIDKAGRRIAFLSSSGGMAASLGVFALYYYLKESNGPTFTDAYGWLPLICLVVSNFMFAIGYGSNAFLCASELLLPSIKSPVISFINILSLLFAFFLAKEFLQIILVLHNYGPYVIFSSLCFISFVIVFVYLPETKGRTFGEIQLLMQPKKAGQRAHQVIL